jgi:hypothetical protein
MTDINPIGARFAGTANQGDLNTGTNVGGVGVAVAQASPYQASATTDKADPYEVHKGDKLAAMLKDMPRLKTVTAGTDGAVLAVEKLDARNRQLEDQLNVAEKAAEGSLASITAQTQQIAKIADYNIEKELEKVTWTPMAINDPPPPKGETVRAGWFRGERVLPPTEAAMAEWRVAVQKNRDFVTQQNIRLQNEAREAKKAEIEKTPIFERKAEQMRDATKAIMKAIGDANINEKEHTGVLATVREELGLKREQQMLMEEDFNSVSAYAMNLRDAIKELDDELLLMPESDKDFPAKKYLMAELQTRKRTIAAIGRDLKNGMQNNAGNLAKMEQRLAKSDALLDTLGKLVSSVQAQVEDLEGMLRTYGPDQRMSLTIKQFNQIRELTQKMSTEFEDAANKEFADLMNAQPELDFAFAKKEGARRGAAAALVDPILQRKQQSDDDMFATLTSTTYDGPTKRIGSGTGIESAIRNGLESDELFMQAQKNPPPSAQQ